MTPMKTRDEVLGRALELSKEITKAWAELHDTTPDQKQLRRKRTVKVLTLIKQKETLEWVLGLENT